MNATSMPGFTAETSLYRTLSNYRTKGVHGCLPGPRAVVPQLRISTVPGCGDCTPLRWPDGTPTGACARACCDVLGRCSTETCPCGGGGVFNVGWGQLIAL
jgi:hypothetical protein